MPRGKGIYDDESTDDSSSRQEDSGETQGDAPDVAETDDEPTA